MRILSMSGFVPEHICDTVRFTRYSGERNLSHYCGYASDYISQVLYDDSIDGAVFPKSCDSTRIISSYLSPSGKFLYQFHIPPYGAAGGEDFFAASIRQYKEEVERYYHIEICDIRERVDKINRRNRQIARLYENIAGVSYGEYFESIHHMLCQPLSEQNADFQPEIRKPTEKKVFLAGSFLSNTEIVRIIEESGLTIVGDTLTESGRLASTPPVVSREDIYREIARSILSQRLSPTQNSFREIVERDMEEIRRKGVKGVIFVTQKYCEPYDYLYPVYRDVMEGMGVDMLKLSLNDTEDGRKAALAVEAFADTL